MADDCSIDKCFESEYSASRNRPFGLMRLAFFTLHFLRIRRIRGDRMTRLQSYRLSAVVLFFVCVAMLVADAKTIYGQNRLINANLPPGMVRREGN